MAPARIKCIAKEVVGEGGAQRTVVGFTIDPDAGNNPEVPELSLTVTVTGDGAEFTEAEYYEVTIGECDDEA
jgi:hypothetical protein